LKYIKYGGDEDGFTRCGTQEEKAIVDDNDWNVIVRFVQNLIPIKRGLAAAAFIQSMDESLRQHCDNEETIKAILEIAKYV
jgi:hypothetical protein